MLYRGSTVIRITEKLILGNNILPFSRHSPVSKDNACQNVVAVSTDTTSVISGDHHGSVVKHERKLGKVLLKVWCLEHIVDLSQKKAFKAIFHATKAPSPANGDFKVNHS